MTTTPAAGPRAVTIAKPHITPGELALVVVDGIRLAIGRTDGRFYAIDDTCTHEQCSLSEEGTLEGTIVTCGCHGAQFDVTNGAVMAPPAPEPVKAYPVRESDDASSLIIEI